MGVNFYGYDFAPKTIGGWNAILGSQFIEVTRLIV
jgi:hypothetical protein